MSHLSANEHRSRAKSPLSNDITEDLASSIDSAAYSRRPQILLTVSDPLTDREKPKSRSQQTTIVLHYLHPNGTPTLGDDGWQQVAHHIVNQYSIILRSDERPEKGVSLDEQNWKLIEPILLEKTDVAVETWNKRHSKHGPDMHAVTSDTCAERIEELTHSGYDHDPATDTKPVRGYIDVKKGKKGKIQKNITW